MADDNLKTAITGAGLGAVLLEVVRRASDAWQKREQARADEKQKLNARPVDASGQLPLFPGFFFDLVQFPSRFLLDLV